MYFKYIIYVGIIYILICIYLKKLIELNHKIDSFTILEARNPISKSQQDCAFSKALGENRSLMD